MTKIFINYRRAPTGREADHLASLLGFSFGTECVFLDVRNIVGADNWLERLHEQVDACDAMVVLISKDWAEELDEQGRRRLENPDDPLTLEIARALRSRVPVLPVLIDDAIMPSVERLPKSLWLLTLQHGLPLRNNSFTRDAEDIIVAIRRRFEERRKDEAKIAARVLGRQVGELGWFRFRGALAAGALFAVGVFVGPVLLTRIGLPLLGVGPSPKVAVDPGPQPTEEHGIDRSAAGGNGLPGGKTVQALPHVTKTPIPLQSQGTPSVQSFRDSLVGGQSCAFCPEMVWVQPGKFMMGSPAAEIEALTRLYSDKKESWAAEGPQRSVEIKQPIAIGRFEVTFSEWGACAADDGCRSQKEPWDQGWGADRRPVINVSWSDAKEYLAWLSRKTGREYRLLAESEWEYAARAGSKSRYSFGENEDDICEFGNVGDLTAREKYPNWTVPNCRDGFINTAPVGSRKPNAFGLYDMHGNVWEWVEDCWHDSYRGAPNVGVAWIAGCAELGRRVLRGGSWNNGVVNVRSADRGAVSADTRNGRLGFRVSRF